MLQYGNAIVRTCYLLCGDLELAHHAAQRIFIRVQSHASVHEYTEPMLTILLRLTLSLCPCRAKTRCSANNGGLLSQMLALPPHIRKAAILCLYHSLSPHEAADLLHISERRMLRLLNYAREALSLRTT